MAAAAATADPRFPPLRESELGHVQIEVSVLGPLVPLTSPADLVIGRDGLVAEQRGLRGLLLPQVALQYRWTPEQFLIETCRKAGLPGDAWRLGAHMSRFEAEVFAEGEEGGRKVS